MKTPNINKNFLIILLGILAAIGPLTIDMYIPGFSLIAEDFNTDENRVAFTMTSYFIGIALGQLAYGPLVDKYGRKKPLLIGLLIYIFAAIGCTFSTSIEMMVALRFFQALGGSAGMVAATAIITDVYKPDYRARAFSLIMLVMGIAPIAAPSFGSFFIEYFNWKAIFFFLGIFATTVGLLIYFFLPETSKFMHSDKLKFKKVSGDYLSVLRNRTFFYYTMAGSIANSMIFAYIASSAFIFLTYYGLSKTTFSFIFGLNASGMIFGSYLNGLLTKKVYYIKILRFAILLLTGFSVFFSFLVFFNPSIAYQWVVLGIFAIQSSLGFTYPNAIAASLAPFTEKSGSASALNGALRMGISALVTAVVGFTAANSAFTMFAIMAVLAILATTFLRFAKKYS